MAVTESTPVVLKCRYRLATGCTYTSKSQPGLHVHEKSGAGHAGHRIVLTACPVCGDDQGDEMGRALHLSQVHGIRAKSERRQDLDARQVKEIYAERYGAAAGLDAADAPDAPDEVPEAPSALAPGTNGHAPVSGTLVLADAQHAFGALVDEVEALREENAELRVKLQQVRDLLGD